MARKFTNLRPETITKQRGSRILKSRNAGIPCNKSQFLFQQKSSILDLQNEKMDEKIQFFIGHGIWGGYFVEYEIKSSSKENCSTFLPYSNQTGITFITAAVNHVTQPTWNKGNLNNTSSYCYVLSSQFKSVQSITLLAGWKGNIVTFTRNSLYTI